MKRANLTVLTGVQVSRILIENKRAVGIEYASSGTTHHCYAASEILVTSGAIGTPKLLMLSGIGLRAFEIA